MPTATTAATFDADVLSSPGPVLVDFWAAWCGPCRALAPQLDRYAATHPQVQVVKVDVDAEPALGARYRVTSIPMLALFIDGALVTQLVGARTAEQLERELAAHLP